MQNIGAERDRRRDRLSLRLWRMCVLIGICVEIPFVLSIHSWQGDTAKRLASLASETAAVRKQYMDSQLRVFELEGEVTKLRARLDELEKATKRKFK